ncbi:MAG: hypothetical protein A3E87_05355 [Gammaproteobacteria bacterium RIFCSPHIGHO2_12_FULL_35_23]|nr:MAG: hypothetical protein A3E87_05355 [Gammaproteobacteria bacterium RIFCSPHIGHO2_12_FULL_35_23]
MRVWNKYFVTNDLNLVNDYFPCAKDVEYFDKSTSFVIEKVALKKEILDDNKYYKKEIRKGIERKILKTDKVLSLGSGNGEHEIPLILNGYNIEISDFNEPLLTTVKEIFPEANFHVINLLHPDFEKKYAALAGKYDVILVPGLIYAFNNFEAKKIFNNIKVFLKNEGRLVLNVRSKNSMLTWLVDNILTKIECKLRVKFLKIGMGYFTQMHGYRRTIKEVIQLVQSLENYSATDVLYLDSRTELSRSYILSIIPGLSPLIRVLFKKYCAYSNFIEFRYQRKNA